MNFHKNFPKGHRREFKKVDHSEFLKNIENI
jgi:hypothetical protein